MHPTHGGGGPGPGGGRAKKVSRRFFSVPQLGKRRSGRNVSPWFIKVWGSRPAHKLKPVGKEANDALVA